MLYGKKFKLLEELERAIYPYVKFYNEKRFRKKLGCLVPL